MLSIFLTLWGLFVFSEFQAALVDDADSSDLNTPVHLHAPTTDASTSKSKVPLKKGIPFLSRKMNLIHHRQAISGGIL